MIKIQSDFSTMDVGNKNITIDDLLFASKTHIEDVKKVANFISYLLSVRACHHDFDKIENIDLFYKAHQSGWKDIEWWENHKKISNHHPDISKEDIDLLDIIEMIIDCSVAGLARKGSIYDISIDPKILQKAFDNTTKLIRNNITLY